MAKVDRPYELRCPVHGFIPISDWERDIINQPAFQRLRRIRQLAWTDYVYPGAMHTRFEHSLGVMHIATQLYNSIRRRSADLLASHQRYTDEELDKDEQIVRLTALLHDTGHSPFSHAGEENFPVNPDSQERKPYKHEAYSATVIRHVLKDTIDYHPGNKLGIKADEVADLLDNKSASGKRLVWRELIDSQMDADRMDYLLRDSLHIGVDYGRYDWRRLLNTIYLVEMGDRGLRIGVTEGGVHAAEALVLARYYMFTQVYFHKTRVAYDHHYRHALKDILGGTFPEPTKDQIDAYLKWDDWRVLGALADGKGGEHGDRIRQRCHYREIYHTRESPAVADRKLLQVIQNRLKLDNLVVATESSKTSTYKLDPSDISVVTEDEQRRVDPLSEHSSIVKHWNQHPLEIVRLYSTPENASQARAQIAAMLEKE
jgi:uncharacterized protein